MKLTCNFVRAQAIFPECLQEAQKWLSAAAVDAYVEGANAICKMGRGEEPLLVYLEMMPEVAHRLGEEVIPEVISFTRSLARSPNSRAMAPFLQSLLAASHALESVVLFREYLNLVMDTMERTMPKIHGIDRMYESVCLPDFLEKVPFLFSQLSLGGMKNWVDYGVKNYGYDPEKQRAYFQLQTADSRAVLQKERRGTLFVGAERSLDLYLRGLWGDEAPFVPYSLAFDQLRKPVPFLDELGIHLPDVYEERNDIPALDRYRALVAHIAAHRRWTSPLMADNYSPFQRISIEAFEDARVERLALREYPGLAKIWRALHPVPTEGACPEGVSCIRHRLAMLSRALLDPAHSYTDPAILKYCALFDKEMQAGESSTRKMSELGVQFISETRKKSDSSPKVYFTDTEVDYRDDNRQMWRFFEDGDEEVYEKKPEQKKVEEEPDAALPPRLWREWDWGSQYYRPDWVSVFEHLHPRGDSAEIDRLLQKHAALAKKLQKVIDLLKPQQKVRIRYQQEGSELDLDIAIRSLIDYKSGVTPDPRINMDHKHDGRSVAVSVLLDLSASLSEVPPGCAQSKLELSREAVTLLAWAIDKIGDPFAIGGFHSNTRHEVRYLHIKGYGEGFDPAVKGRLAAMEAGFSTRMGAALRHAGHYLAHQQADKKLMLILTDGEPADIDVKDPRYLIEDARMAVHELDRDGIYPYCINLDPKADEYVAGIFDRRYTVIDNVSTLPERLTQLFMTLTR